MSEERTYPREWFAYFRHFDEPSAEVFVRETAHCLYDSRGRKHSKRNSYERWYPTREEAQAVIDMRVKHEAERDAANRVRAAAPKLLEACKRIVAHFVIVHSNAIGPGERFCKMCGLNSETETHSMDCAVKQAEAAIAEAERSAT